MANPTPETVSTTESLAPARKTISIVTPYYNEEDSLPECVETVRTLFAEKLPDYDFEHIFCDNDSNDRSLEILRAYAAEDPRIKIIVNSRNFGILKNTYNGVMAATGDAVLLFLPADLQDPPELIPQFVELWESGYEVVFGMRRERDEGFVLRTARKAYYRLLSRVSYVDYPPDAGDFQLIDRRVHKAMMSIDDAQPFMRLMTFDVGFRSVGVPYTWKKRKHGKSRNPLYRLFEQGLNGIIAFSSIPMRAALFLGFGLSMVSILYAISIAALTLFGVLGAPRGIPTMITAMFFFGGVQLFFIGMLGEYIIAIFNQVRRRPMVVERERINFD